LPLLPPSPVAPGRRRWAHWLFLLALLACWLFRDATDAGALPLRQGVSRAGFAIQVGAFAHVGNAERLAARLQTKGVEAYYFRRDNGLYAVRFGDYSTWDQARWNGRKLVAAKVIDSFFVVDSANAPGITREHPPEVRQLPDAAPRIRPPGEMGLIAARTAERFVGIPYRWGGDTVVEGMDCSGFVRAVYNLCGVNIPRTSQEQFRSGDPVERDELHPGDLVFFGDSSSKINHVGIYVGEGRFVHAPRRGDDIRVSSLDEGYFNRRFRGGRRCL
jgi:cell wall-associated NlpC family hydrolase